MTVQFSQRSLKPLQCFRTNYITGCSVFLSMSFWTPPSTGSCVTASQARSVCKWVAHPYSRSPQHRLCLQEAPHMWTVGTNLKCFIKGKGPMFFYMNCAGVILEAHLEQKRFKMKKAIFGSYSLWSRREVTCNQKDKVGSTWRWDCQNCILIYEKWGKWELHAIPSFPGCFINEKNTGGEIDCRWVYCDRPD